MLEKPNLPDDLIIQSLQQHYGLQVVGLEFLPIGNDPTAWVYKVLTVHDAAYFLKVKRGNIALKSLAVPRYLVESGITQVVSPIPNPSRQLYTSLHDFSLILFPFIDGQTGMTVGLSSEQWTTFGAVLSRIHATHLPPEVFQNVPHESFVLNPRWMNAIQSIQQKLSAATFNDELERELAAFWQEHSDEIARIISRAEELGRLLQAQSLPFVLCHADIHTANILIDRAGQLFIVDWDQPIFAPRERDLMFVVGEGAAGSPLNPSEEAFFSGYGQTDINWLAMAYYRYEWVVQEIAEFGELVLITPDIGAETKQDAVRGFQQLFLPDDVAASAYASETYLI